MVVNNLSRFLTILGLILLIVAIVVGWFTVVGWAFVFLLGLLGISVAHNWGMLILVGLAVSIIGGCIGKNRLDKEDKN